MGTLWVARAGCAAPGAGCRRPRMCGIGAAEAVLHIRPGPAGGGSAESCGNVPVFNTGEILPCAERPALHMGARPLETEVLARVPESCGKLEVDPRGQPSPMCNTTARAGKSSSREAPLPSDEAAFPRLAREDPDPPGSDPPRSDPAGDRPHRADPRSLGHTSWFSTLRCFRERSSRPLRSVPLLAFPSPRIMLSLLFLNDLTGAWCSLTLDGPYVRGAVPLSQCTYRCVVLPDRLHDLAGTGQQVSMHLQVRGAP